jgi:hypothetical protein
MEKKQLQEVALRILKEIGVIADENSINIDSFVGNQGSTKYINVFGSEVSAEATVYDKGGCRIEVHFSLPENACMADTYIEYCVEKEGIPVGGWNHNPYSGRKTKGPAEKHTEAYSPWHNRFFCVDSMNYGDGEFDEAVENAITLAKPFVKHLADVPSLRYWNPEDKEVIAKAKEIIDGADFDDEDVDREYKSHWLVDRNSFMKGWFFPFNDRGHGTFDTVWPSSLDYAAKGMGHPGSFEYAVACVLLENPEYIAKARKACRIREETRTYRY